MINRALRLVFPVTLLLVMANQSALTGPSKLTKQQESALRDRVSQMYKAWSTQDWVSMFKFMTPDTGTCAQAADAAEIAAEIGQWPVSWQLVGIRLDGDSPHHTFRSECSAKVWPISAVAWVRMKAAFQKPQGPAEPQRDFEQPWLLLENQWYLSLSEH